MTTRGVLAGRADSQEHWISVSDLMAGLMMIFLFIAISYMIHVIREQEKIKEIAITYSRLQEDLYEDLYNEFEKDLENWNAVIDKQSLSVRFKAPDVLFEVGSFVIRQRFKLILDSFFPRYVRLITDEKYKEDIEEVRIEGHTSSEGRSIDMTDDDRYFYNMELSQDRTRSTLRYVLNLEDVQEEKEWLQNHLTANGLSSSKLVLRDGEEDMIRSRRVEFRIRTNAEKRIVKILEED